MATVKRDGYLVEAGYNEEVEGWEILISRFNNLQVGSQRDEFVLSVEAGEDLLFFGIVPGCGFDRYGTSPLGGGPRAKDIVIFHYCSKLNDLRDLLVGYAEETCHMDKVHAKREVECMLHYMLLEQIKYEPERFTEAIKKAL